MRPINADSVKKSIEELKQSPWYNEKNLGYFSVRKEAVEVVELLCIDEEPTLDVEPVKHGHWEFIGGYGYQYRCSKCARCAERKTIYCPHCGAKMNKETKE